MEKQSDKRVVFLRGKKANLRPLNKETDLEDCVRWINDEEVNKYLSLFLPVTKNAEATWFDGHDNDQNNVVLAIETVSGELIGVMGLHQINWRDRTATTGAYIGEKKFWGKGYGTEAKMLLLNYAFNTLNLRKINSAVIDYNKASLAYSFKCGYQIEGRRRKQYYKEGRYRDEILLGVFKKNWLPIWKKFCRQ